MRTCRDCGKTDGQIEFRKGANICIPCFKLYLKNYRKRNRGKLKKQIMDWKSQNKEKYRETCREYYHTPDGKAKHIARVEKTPRTWLSHVLGALRSHSRKPGLHDPKSGPQRDFDIDLDYLMELWEKQKGVCAITAIDMSHRFNDMMAVSIDRIDSSKGHVKGNIQLVCQCMNRLKNNHHSSEVQAILDKYFFERLRRFAVETGQVILTAEQLRCRGDGVLRAVPGAPSVREYVDAIFGS